MLLSHEGGSNIGNTMKQLPHAFILNTSRATHELGKIEATAVYGGGGGGGGVRFGPTYSKTISTIQVVKKNNLKSQQYSRTVGDYNQLSKAALQWEHV